MLLKRRTLLLATIGSLSFAAGLGGGISVPLIPVSHPQSPTYDHAAPADVAPQARPTPSPNAPTESSPNAPESTVVPPASEAASIEPLQGRLQLAQLIWDRVKANDPFEDRMETRSLFLHLAPDMAGFFIEKFRSAQQGSPERQYAFELALACGGPEAANLLVELCEAPPSSATRILRTCASLALVNSGLIRRPRALPLEDRLLAQARSLLASPAEDDRQLGVAILGFGNPTDTVPTLVGMVSADPDLWVRCTATRELGWIGDATTLIFLRDYRSTLGNATPMPGSDGGLFAYNCYHLTRAIDDAIEELEERLQTSDHP